MKLSGVSLRSSIQVQKANNVMKNTVVILIDPRIDVNQAEKRPCLTPSVSAE